MALRAKISQSPTVQHGPSRCGAMDCGQELCRGICPIVENVRSFLWTAPGSLEAGVPFARSFLSKTWTESSGLGLLFAWNSARSFHRPSIPIVVANELMNARRSRAETGNAPFSMILSCRVESRANECDQSFREATIECQELRIYRLRDSGSGLGSIITAALSSSRGRRKGSKDGSRGGEHSW